MWIEQPVMDIVLYRQKNINVSVISLVNVLDRRSYHERIRTASEGGFQDSL